MKISQLFMAGATLVAVHSAYAGLGQDAVYGVGTGVVSLGVFYGAQGSYFNETEGRALAAATLVGVVLPAFAQAYDRAGVLSYLTTLAAAAITFGLGKHIYENQESLLAQLQGSQPGVAAQVGTSAQVAPAN
ncbi:MAG: hypothetical protein ACHQVS_02940 [Candidatus Babeliales bacterium]